MPPRRTIPRLPVDAMRQILRGRDELERFDFNRARAYEALARVGTIGMPMEIANMVNDIRTKKPSLAVVSVLRARYAAKRYSNRTYKPLTDLNLFLSVRWGIAIPNPYARR